MVDGVRVGVGVVLEQWVREWVTPELAQAGKCSSLRHRRLTPEPMNVMRVLAHHIHLLITTASNAPPQVVIETARANLTYVLEAFGLRMQHILRTVSGMLSWAAVLLLRVSPTRRRVAVKKV